MSKAANTWYVLLAPFRAMFRLSSRPGLPDGPTVVVVLLLVAFGAGGAAAVASGWLTVDAEGRDPVQILMPYAMVVTVLAVLGLSIRQMSAFGRGYLRALEEPGPHALVTMLEQSFRKASFMPDIDAHRAQAVAIAYALYGHGEDAMRALAPVNWGKRAPLIQSTGLIAEALTELFCAGDAQHALERCTKARALASVSKALPGAAQSEKFVRTCVALCEVLANGGTEQSVRALEAGATSRLVPLMRILASFGLAVAMEQRGDVARARALRSYLLDVAPHCAPLRRTAEDFLPREQPEAGLPRPVTRAMAAPDAWAPPASEVPAGKRAPHGGPLGLAFTIAITLAFLVVWALLSPGR
jgi:hypothetical protein